MKCLKLNFLIPSISPSRFNSSSDPDGCGCPGQLDEELHQQPHSKVHTPAPESGKMLQLATAIPKLKHHPLFGTCVALIWRYNWGCGVVTCWFLDLTLKFHLPTSSSHWLSLASTNKHTTGSQGTLHNEQRIFFTAAGFYLDTIHHLAWFHSKERPNILKHAWCCK